MKTGKKNENEALRWLMWCDDERKTQDKSNFFKKNGETLIGLQGHVRLYDP